MHVRNPLLRPDSGSTSTTVRTSICNSGTKRLTDTERYSYVHLEEPGKLMDKPNHLPPDILSCFRATLSTLSSLVT